MNVRQIEPKSSESEAYALNEARAQAKERDNNDMMRIEPDTQETH